MKTTEKKLNELKKAAQEANKAFFEYRKELYAEHGKPTPMIDDIIALHKKGMTNREIAEQGFNRNYVNQQVGLFKARKRIQSTTVKRFIPKPKK